MAKQSYERKRLMVMREANKKQRTVARDKARAVKAGVVTHKRYAK